MEYMIGIDLGTQGTKTVIYDRAGNRVAEAFESSKLKYEEKGKVEQDPNEMLASCLDTLKQCMEKSGIAPSEIAVIGIDGQMAGVLGIDKFCEPATPYDSWLDQRCSKYFQTIREWGEERFISITGCPVTYAHGPKIIWWKHEFPQIFNRIASFIPPAVYCTMKMCGIRAEEAFIDYTYLHFTNFASVERKEWSAELMDAFGIPAEKFPQITKPWKVVGRLTHEMADNCGLTAGTPMVAGCGDTAANAFGAGITRPGLLYDVGGTASTLAVAVSKFTPDTTGKLLLFPAAVVEGLYTPLAYMNGAGMCLKWFKDEILSSNDREFTYDELNRQIEMIAPGSNSLLFIPHFSGRVCPNDPYLRGAWLTLDWHHTKAHMYRSIMESIGYEYKIYFNRIKELVPEQDFEQILAVAGASKSPQFRQIKSDILGLDEVTISRSDTATLACAVIGGYGVGLFDDLASTINDLNSICERTKPNFKNFKKYEPFAQAYEKSLEHMSRYYHDIGPIIMIREYV